MALRRAHSTKGNEKPVANGNGSLKDDEQHTYSHSHSFFSHTHSHGDEGHNYEAERIMAAWEGSADRGSRITLIGLFSNVGLTAAKGLAGWYMHSASLLADAGHSLSGMSCSSRLHHH